MAVWVVRAGREGEREDFVLKNNILAVGWSKLSDLSTIESPEELKELCRNAYPEANNYQLGKHYGQLWRFVHLIRKGDLVALPLHTRYAIAIGEVIGDYEYHSDFPEDARHTRKVKWIKDDIPRNVFDQDLRFSFQTLLTVSQVRAEKAEERIRVLLGKGKIPDLTNEPEIEEEAPDLEEFSRDQIIQRISQKSKGHDFTLLINAILLAQGYRTQVSPPGPDSGVDILAGKGSMGFDPPCLCVQVKSGVEPIGTQVLDQLKGVMDKFNAHQGLLVSLGGFNNKAANEARRIFFKLRLWNSEDVVKALLESYESLPDDIKAELPLKRIWTLVPEQ